jgi:hypothetical protein
MNIQFITTSVFRSTPPEQTLPAAAMLDRHQRFWIDRLLPSLPHLTTARARRPCQYSTVDKATPCRPMLSCLLTVSLGSTPPRPLQRCQGCATRWRSRRTAIINWLIMSRPIKSQHPSGRPDGTSRHSEIDSTKNATHTAESRSRVPRAIRLADQACQYCRCLGNGSH